MLAEEKAKLAEEDRLKREGMAVTHMRAQDAKDRA